MKEKLKSKTFWLTLVGAVVVLLQAFGLRVDVPVLNEVITAVCSVAIVAGVMIDDTKKKEETSTKDNSTTEEDSQTDQSEEE